MRVVLDTNVLISALLFKRRLGQIEIMIKTGEITPCFIITSFQELQNVLRYEKLLPFMKASGINPEEIIKNLTPHCLIFDNPKDIPNAVSDTSDNFILAAAISAQAEYIVTGDKMLLALREFKNIPIVPPQKFLQKLTVH